jgi:hypothetical protein
MHDRHQVTNAMDLCPWIYPGHIRDLCPKFDKDTSGGHIYSQKLLFGHIFQRKEGSCLKKCVFITNFREKSGSWAHFRCSGTLCPRKKSRAQISIFMKYFSDVLHKSVDIPEEISSMSDHVIATVLALAILRIKFADKVRAWQMAESKALNWLLSQDPAIYWQTVINLLC